MGLTVAEALPDWQPIAGGQMRTPRLSLRDCGATLSTSALMALGLTKDRAGTINVQVSTNTGQVRFARAVNGPGDLHVAAAGHVGRLLTWARAHGYAFGAYDLEQQADGALIATLRKGGDA